MDVERLLEDTRASGETYIRQNTAYKGRIAALERQVEDFLQAEESNTRQSAVHRARIADLERRLEELQLGEEGHNKRRTAHNARLQELEQVLTNSDSGHKDHVCVEDLTSISARGSFGRASLVGEALAIRPPLGELLRGSGDHFVLKVRDNSAAVQQDLNTCGEIQLRSIEAQMKSALAAHSARRELKSSVLEFGGKFELEAERRSAADTMEASIILLKALREEMQIQHQLSHDEQEEVSQRIDYDMAQCEDELRLLRTPTALGDVPETLLQTLVELSTLGLSSREWADGFSPIHWAAQHGRRDIILYLLRIDGCRVLLNSRDIHGRTPLYYAQNKKWAGMVTWLRDVVGATAPIHSKEQRPHVNEIPEQYLVILEQVEMNGWSSMNWKDGYTMLHWSADKGYADLCRYLVQLDADPGARDIKDRDPIDIARNAGHSNVASLLEDLLSQPRETISLSTFSRPQGTEGQEARRKEFARDRVRTTMSFGDNQSEVSSHRSSVESAKAIPEAYVKVMEQIEKIGWEKMQWARGFTLLHWAAKNDMPDLVARFMYQKGNPNHRDDNGRSAIDYARDHVARAALARLSQGPPTELPKIMSSIVSRRERNSIIVEGRPLDSSRLPIQDMSMLTA